MQQRTLGTTQRSVTIVGLGTMPLAIEGRPSEDDAIAVIHAGLDAGMTWLDTADSYGLDASDVGYGERLVAKALQRWPGSRDQIFVTTKAGYVRPNGAWEVDGRPEHLKAACEASLRALGVSAIGLFHLHGVDPRVPYEDSVGALAELKREGKIQHIALANVDVGQIQEAARIVNVAAVQNRCNVYERHCFANGVIDLCERKGIAFIAHSPVGGHRGHGRVANDAKLARVAERHGVSHYEVALAWLLASSPAMFAIPGASRPSSAQSSARAAELRLRPEDRAELERAFPRAGFVLKQLVTARRIARHALRKVKARAALIAGS